MSKMRAWDPTDLREIIARTPRSHFMSLIIRESMEESGIPVRYVLPPIGTVWRMITALSLTPDCRVLEIGTGFGYTTSILSSLARQVHTVERLQSRFELSQQALEELGCENVTFHRGSKLEPHPAASEPFDAILISASGLDLHQQYARYLADGGRMVAAQGSRQGSQRLLRVVRKGKQLEETSLGEVKLLPRLGDLAVDLGLAPREQVEEAVKFANMHGLRTGMALITKAGIDEVDVYRLLALQHGVPMGRVSTLISTIDHSLLDMVPRAYLEQNQIIPIRKQSHTLIVATTEAQSIPPDFVSALNAREVRPYLLTPTDYRRLWKLLDLGKLDADEIEFEDPEPAPETAPAAEVFDTRVIGLYESMLLDAVAERASDIHLERYDQEVRVRFRVDGECLDQRQYRLKPTEMMALVNVVKVNANMDIAERRLPQGGRIRKRIGRNIFDMRVQTQPCLHSEHVVIRLLPQDSNLLTIEDLGFPAEIASQYRRLVDSPAGLLLVVGPTGSGKSTTLYAALQILAEDSRRKVITAEDPIEYSIRGIQQTQINPRIGFAFADAMRSFVRQDPDVILVGEIRDHETALEAMRASQTGHLVLSTLHANDTVDAVQRLIDLQLHPNSIASELMGIIAQRLAKRICASCKKEVDPDPEIIKELFPDGAPATFKAYRGKGCPRCHQRGTHGRIAAIEFLRVNSTVRRAISQRLQVDELRDLCLAAGMITMRDSALQLVTDGLIPLEELPRILPAERMVDERAALQKRS